MPSMRFAALAASLTFAALSRADVVTVYVFNFEFTTDATLASQVDPVIQVGDTIRWEWVDLGHNVLSVSGSSEAFDSGFPVEIGTTFDHSFTQLGTHWYYCVPHAFDNGDGTASGMAGTVTVVPEPTTVALLLPGLLFAARRRRGAKMPSP